MINDSVASLTALAATHNATRLAGARRAQGVEPHRAEALQMHVIDFIAPSLPALLDKLDGYQTKDPQRPFTLHLAGAHIDTRQAGLLHAAAEHAHRPEPHQAALPRRASPGSASRSSIPASCCRARSAASRS